MAKRRNQRLAEYRAKREFRTTPEPKGQAKPASNKLQFCVQKHLARSLHYDFRLEHDGVLLSWAVPKGPSLNPKDKRFAARTEDHPLEYGDFEGVIPEGYGAGIVLLWDRGTWISENGDVDLAIKRGELKVRLDGVKLKGSWVLVRTKASEGGKEQWLLIKHKDEWAGELDVGTFAPLSVKTFGDFPDVLRAKGIPAAWRKRLPVQAGETAALLRRIVNEVSSPRPTGAIAAPLPPAARVPPSALRLGTKRPKLSNLNKTIYPDGFTKGQMIDYYRRVAPLILPHLAGRAVTLKRYPDGINGKAFFHKRCPDHRPPWVKTVSVSSESGESVDYCRIDNISTLLWVANLAAIELHVPLALAKAPDTPTAMVFDLDPGAPAALPACLEVGSRITALLKQLGLKSFTKLSGKKGLHILIPLNSAGVSFGQTKLFARAVAQLLANDDPKHVTAVMRKNDRIGKVFIDWNQNDRSKTMVCAYSLRAENAPVISWPIDDLGSAIIPPSARAMTLPRHDPMSELNVMRQRLPALT